MTVGRSHQPEVGGLESDEGGVDGDADDTEMEVIEEERGVVVEAHTRLKLEFELALTDALKFVLTSVSETFNSFNITQA